jgi:hypothetical protein
VGYRTFDEGFSIDLAQPSTVAEALLNAMDRARIARDTALIHSPQIAVSRYETVAAWGKASCDPYVTARISRETT